MVVRVALFTACDGAASDAAARRRTVDWRLRRWSKCHDEGGALARDRARDDTAAHLLDQGPHDGESQPRAIGRLGAGGSRAIEALEDQRQFVARDARAVVGYLDRDTVRLAASAYMEMNVVAAMVNGIHDEVREHLEQAVWVGKNTEF